jgi:hypothetical protein
VDKFDAGRIVTPLSKREATAPVPQSPHFQAFRACNRRVTTADAALPFVAPTRFADYSRLHRSALGFVVLQFRIWVEVVPLTRFELVTPSLRSIKLLGSYISKVAKNYAVLRF